MVKKKVVEKTVKKVEKLDVLSKAKKVNNNWKFLQLIADYVLEQSNDEAIVARIKSIKVV